jgi:hypothetical protein
MNSILIVGAALIVMATAVLGYDRFSYTTTEKILQIGPLTASAERMHTVSLPPIVGWLLVGSSACVLIFGAWSKKD